MRTVLSPPPILRTCESRALVVGDTFASITIEAVVMTAVIATRLTHPSRYDLHRIDLTVVRVITFEGTGYR